MTFTALLALAVALAMDAFTVALAAGIQLQCVTSLQTIRMAVTFGFFQFAMPIAGWYCGAGLQSRIESYDHWIAFALLAFIGIRMLKEARDMRNRSKPDTPAVLPPDPTRGSRLFILGIATSIDALAVGFSMALLGQEALFPALVIGVICCILTACGLHLGRVMRSFMGQWGQLANVFGGIILIIIGASILGEHGVFEFSSPFNWGRPDK